MVAESSSTNNVRVLLNNKGCCLIKTKQVKMRSKTNLIFNERNYIFFQPIVQLHFMMHNKFSHEKVKIKQTVVTTKFAHLRINREL